MSTTRLPEFTPVPMTDEDRDAVFNALPDRLAGFMKLWGWLHFAKDIEAKAHEKNADQMHAYGLAVWKAAMQHAAEAVPTNWCDELLTGKQGLGQPPYHCPDIERLLSKLRAAILALPLPEQGGPQ